MISPTPSSYAHMTIKALNLLNKVELLICIFSVAKGKPVISEPEIHGVQSLENVTGFLLLMSEGLINALESAHGPEQANQVRECNAP